jgi:hypothetical protein
VGAVRPAARDIDAERPELGVHLWLGSGILISMVLSLLLSAIVRLRRR